MRPASLYAKFYAKFCAKFLILTSLATCAWISMPKRAQAEWGPTGGMSGYMGEHYFGGTFINTTGRHIADIALGVSHGIASPQIYQLGARYVYSPFNYDFNTYALKTNIVGVGLMVTRCLCEDVVVQNLNIFPSRNYYDETAYRFGLILEHNLTYEKFNFYFNWVLLDQLLIATYNNKNMQETPLDYWSAGIGIRFYPTF